jgi:signal transduction histidine kinase
MQRFFLDDLALDAAGAERVIASQKKVELTVEEFEEAPVDGDPELVRQLLMILLDNAVKFTDPGGLVRVRVAMHNGAPTFVVEDTGVGIRSVELPRVFERFFRGEYSGSRSRPFDRELDRDSPRRRHLTHVRTGKGNASNRQIQTSRAAGVMLGTALVSTLNPTMPQKLRHKRFGC